MNDAASARGRILYGRRRGHRLRGIRRELLQSLLPQLRVELPERGTLRPAALFAEPPADIWLEIGFGGGEHLAAQAAAHPEIGFIGCEPFINGVSTVLRHIDDRSLRNVRVHADDARALLDRLPEASLGRVFLLFPDPWPKARHHRRRFVSAETLDLLARALRPGGELRMATDHMEYGRWMLRHVLAHGAFEWLARRAEDWRRRPADGFPSRYESKALAAGRSCLYLGFARRGGATSPPAQKIA